MRDAGTTTVEARLEWWRRVSFTLIALFIAGLGTWFTMMWGQVDKNRDDISEILQQLSALTQAVEANTRAQTQIALQVAELRGSFESLKEEQQRSP